MNCSLRRLAAVSVLGLALPAAAQVKMTGEAASSPLGAVSMAWSGALGAGGMLKPNNMLFRYAFPTNEAYEKAQDTVYWPEKDVVARLAPFALAMEQEGYRPGRVALMTPDEKRDLVHRIYPRAQGLVRDYAGRLAARAKTLKPGEDESDLINDYQYLAAAYPKFLGKSLQTVTDEMTALVKRRDDRIAGHAESEAADLADRSSNVGKPASETAENPVASNRTDARLAEIKVLRNLLRKSSEDRVRAVKRAHILAGTGEPNEAVQSAAVRLVITAAEIESRGLPKNLISEDAYRYGGTNHLADYLNVIVNLADDSPYDLVKSIANNNLLDNNITRNEKDYPARDALVFAARIAVRSKSPEVKKEAISLLLREIQTTPFSSIKELATAEVDRIKAGLSSELKIAKPFEAHVKHDDASLFDFVTGIAALIAGGVGLLSSVAALDAYLLIGWAAIPEVAAFLALSVLGLGVALGIYAYANRHAP